MLSDYFGSYVSPGQAARHLTWYTPDGLIIWQALQFDKMKFVRRETGRDDVYILAALKDPNRAVMLQVNNGQHWVVAIKKNLLNNSYQVADPWMGDKCDVISRYHNITGAAYFARV